MMTKKWVEFRVTGDPGEGYPPYDFTFRSADDRWPTPEAAETAARKLMMASLLWPTPAKLSRRECTYTSTEWTDVPS